MGTKLLLPLVGLAVILAALIWLWRSGDTRGAIPDPPIPSDLSQADPAVLDLIHPARSAILADRANPSLWVRLGMVYEANANHADARACYEQSVAIDPNYARGWFHAAQSRYATSDYELAVDAMRRAAELQGDFTPSHWRLGFWLLEQGDLIGAEASFARATRQSPNDPAGWFGLAMVRMKQHRDEEAAQILEQVLEWTPVNRFYAHQLLGTVYRRLGRIDEAERVLRASAGREISWPDPWTNEIASFHRGAGWKIELPMQLLSMGRTSEAIGMLEGFLRSEPDNSILLSNLAIAYRANDQLDRSITTLQKAVAHREHYHQAHFNLGLAYLMKAERASTPEQAAEFERRAWQHAEFALTVNPSYASGHGLKGRLLERRGDFEAALEAYRVAARDHVSGQYWLELESALLAKLEQWASAVETLEELLIRYPPQPKYVYDLAIAQINAGRTEDASATVARFARQWPNDTRIADLRRQLLTPRGAPARPEVIDHGPTGAGS